MHRLILFPVCFLFAVPSVRADWSHEVSFRRSRSTSLKIVEPHEYRASVSDRQDSIPAVFQLPDANDYVWVEITARDGEKWRKKIEVRDHNETILTVKHRPQEVARSARKYIGKIKNATHNCSRAHRSATKFEFMLEGKEQYTVTLAPNKMRANVTLPEGRYQVRIFTQKGRDLVHLKTVPFQCKQDGWDFMHGCKRR